MSKSESKKTTDSKKRRDPSTEKEIQSGTPLSSTGHNFYELLTLLIKKLHLKYLYEIKWAMLQVL